MSEQRIKTRKELLLDLLSPAELEQVREFIDEGKDLNYDLMNKLCDHFVEDIPHGTLTAKTGDPDQWMFETLEGILDEGTENV